MNDDPISFWLSDGSAWITLSGDACHLNSRKVKEFAREMAGCGTYDFVVDLKACTGMDETFMGILAGMALRLHGHKKGSVRLVGLAPNLDERFRSLGLDQLFEM